MSITYITSTEKYLIDKEVDKIKNKVGIKDNMDLNFLQTESITELQNFTSTFSFFDIGSKLAIISNYQDEKLIEVMETIPENVELIILGELDKRKKVFKYLKKNKFVLELKPLKKNELANWVISSIENLNSKISMKDALKVLELTGETDMYNILRELEKLAFMRETITPNLIERVVNKSLLVNAFDVTNAILYKDINKALEILDKLLNDNQEMIPLLALICKNFCIIQSLNQVHEDDLKEVGVHPFVIKNLRPFRNSFELEKLQQYIDLCQKLDFDLKNGYEPKYVMERLILSIN